MRVWLGGHNTERKREVERHLRGTHRPPTGPVDLAFITPQSADEAAYFAAKVQPRLSPGGAIWTVYPSDTSPDRGAFDVSMADLVHAMANRNLVDHGTVHVSDNSTSTCFRRING
jgi:hypothetical protein